MKKRIHIKSFVLGILVTVLVIGSVTTVFAAATLKKIDVYYDNYKIYVDGELFEATDKNGVIESFSYNGWIFSPFEHIAKALDKNVRWDGKTNSLYITTPAVPTPPKPKASFIKTVPPSEMGPANPPLVAGRAIVETKDSVVMAVGGKTYNDAITFSRNNYFSSEIGYNYDYSKHPLNGKYKKLIGTIGRVEGSIQGNAKFEFWGDGKLIDTFSIAARDNPQQISVDVTEIISLTIIFYCSGEGYNGMLTYAFAGATIE